jgi:Uma2 family endonuclease
MEWSLTGLPLPIVLRPPSPLTDDELMAFSHKNKPFRIERNAKGELEIMTPVGLQSGRRETFIARELDYWAEEQGGFAVGANVGFNLPDGSTLAPDAAWLSDTQWGSLTPEQREKFPPVCPEFIVEVLSANDSPPVLRAKMEVWLANGALLAWMVDPYRETITIYRPGVLPEVLQKPDSIEADAPVAGFRLTTSRLWEKEPPSK